MADERNSDRLVVIGANHRTSSEATRDRLFIPEDQQAAFLRRVAAAGMPQAVVLSTCARTEILGIADHPSEAGESLLALLAEFAGLTPATLGPDTYVHTALDAVGHVFRVAASLDSPIVGEPEVTGQFREAARHAAACGMLGPDLDVVIQAANSAAKRVRTETAIGERSVSMAACALQVARDVHGELSRVSALLVTGGEMGEMILDHLRGAGLSRITVAARSAARAEVAARRYDCHHASLDGIADILPRIDVVVSSLGAGRYLFAPGSVDDALGRRRRRPMLFLDAAIPSDVDPAVNDLDGAFVYSLDDLERIALEGRSQRGEAAAEAESVVAEEVARFARAAAARAAVPTLAALREHFERVRRSVLDDLGLDDPAADEATRRLMNRLLHRPSETLRHLASLEDPATREAESTVRRLFGIDDDKENDK